MVWSKIKNMLFCSGSMLLKVGVFVILAGASCAGQGLVDAPPTLGLAWPTVYTLRAKEVQLGLLSITDPNSLYVNLGVKRDLQVGLFPVLLFTQQVFNIGGKLRVSLSPEVDVALTLHTYHWTDNLRGYEVHLGGLFGILLGRTATLQAGVQVNTGLHCSNWWGCWLVHDSILYVVLHSRLSEMAWALVEVEFTPFRFRLGGLARLLDIVDLRVALTLIPELAVRVGVEGRIVLVPDEMAGK